MELQVATHGGKRRGAGRKPRDEEVPVDVRERLITAKADREEANAKIAQLELAKLAGEVLLRSDVLASRLRQTVAFRARMLAIPTGFCGQFVPPDRLSDAFDALTQMISEALDELADGTSDSR